MFSAVEKISNDEFCLKINTNLYKKEVVMLVCSNFMDKHFIFVKQNSDRIIKLCFSRKNNADIDLKSFIGQFCNDLLEYQIRDDIESKYHTIRELIVQQAFSPIEINEDING